MADAVHINHASLSAKPDNPNQSIMSSNEWNADEILSGGQDGQIILKDSTKATGAKWGQAITINVGNITYSGSSPTPPEGVVPVTVNDHCVVLLVAGVQSTTSGGAVTQVNVRRNGVVIGGFFVASATSYTALFPFVENTPGTVTYDLVASVGGGQTFTNFSGSTFTLTFPIF